MYPIKDFKDKLVIGMLYRLAVKEPWNDDKIHVHHEIYEYKKCLLDTIDLANGELRLTPCETELDNNGFYNESLGWLFVPLSNLYVVDVLNN